MKKSFFLTGLTILLFFRSMGQTEISGTISKDSILLKSKSPYFLTGTLTIKNNAKLTIENGCVMNLANYNILVGSSTPGTITAGNVSFSTTVTSEKHIIFQDGGQGTLDGSTFDKVYILVADDAGLNLSFKNNNFRQVVFPFIISPGTSPVITDNSCSNAVIGLQGNVKQTRTLQRYSWSFMMTGTVNISNNAVLTLEANTRIDLQNYVINVGNGTPGTLYATQAYFSSSYITKSKIVFKDGGQGNIISDSFSNVYLSVESDAGDYLTIKNNQFTNIDYPIKLDINKYPAISGNLCPGGRINLTGTSEHDISLQKYDWDYTLGSNIYVNKNKSMTIGAGIKVDLHRYRIFAGNTTPGTLYLNVADLSSSYAEGSYICYQDGGKGFVTGSVLDKVFIKIEDDASDDIQIRGSSFSGTSYPVVLSAAKHPDLKADNAGIPKIGVMGNVTADNTLPKYKWDYRLTEGISIRNGATLTIADSANVDLDTYYINIGAGASSTGNLKASNVFFRGQTENRGRLSFTASSGGLFENCSFERCFIRIDNASPVFQHSRFYHSKTAIEIRNAANPVFRYNDFYNNELAVSQAGTQTINATENFWGHPSGPQHTENAGGSGEIAQGTILFKPFSGLPNTGSVQGSVAPSVFNFGMITTGTRIDTSFVISNKGNIDLLVTDVHNNTSNISLQCGDRFWIPAGSDLQVNFSFSSLSGKPEKDTIAISNSTPGTPVMKVAVSAFGIINQIHIRFNNFNIDSFPLVKCFFTVTDQANIPVSEIIKSNITLKEDGKTIPDFSFFSGQAVASNVAAALVIDQSGSMQGQKLRDAKNSATDFIRELSPVDKASVFSFNDRITVRKAFTSDKAILEKAVQSISPTGETAIFDAIARAIDSVRYQPGNKAVIALTDGLDNSSSVTPDVIVAMALQYGVSVYTIGLGEDAEESTIRYIAGITGGEYYYAPTSEILSIIYKRISGQLQNQYLITYQAPLTNPFPRTLALSVIQAGLSVTDSVRYTTEKQKIEFLSGAKPFLLEKFTKNSRSYFYCKTAKPVSFLGNKDTLRFILKSGSSYLPCGGSYMGDSIFQFWTDLAEELTRSQITFSLPDSIIHNGSWIRMMNKPASFTVPVSKYLYDQGIDVFAGGTLGVRLLAGGVAAGPSIAAASVSAKGTAGMGLRFNMESGGDELITRRFEIGTGLKAESPAINAVVGDIQAGVEAGIMVKGILGQTMQFPAKQDNDAIKAKTLFLLETLSLGASSLSPDCSILKAALKESLKLIDPNLSAAYNKYYYSNSYGLNIEGKASLGASYATGSGSDQNKLKLAEAGVNMVFSGQFLRYLQNNDQSINFGYALEAGFSLLSLEVMNVDLGKLAGYTKGTDFTLGAKFTSANGFHSLNLGMGVNESAQVTFGQRQNRREIGFIVPKKVITRALGYDNIIGSVAPFFTSSASKRDFQIGKDYFLESMKKMFTYTTGPLDNIGDHIVIEQKNVTTNALEIDATVKIDAAFLIGAGLELGATLSYADEISSPGSQHTFVNGKLIPLAIYHQSPHKDLISLKDEITYLFENAPALVADLIKSLLTRLGEAVLAGADFVLSSLDATCTLTGNISGDPETIVSEGYAELTSYLPDLPFKKAGNGIFSDSEVLHGYSSQRVVTGNNNLKSTGDTHTGTLYLVSKCYKVNIYNDSHAILPVFDPCQLAISIQPAMMAGYGFSDHDKTRARIYFYNFHTLNWEEITGDLNSHPDTVTTLINRSGTYAVGILYQLQDDKEPPVIGTHYPANGVVLNADSVIRAEITEPLLGSGVDLSACRLLIDGREADVLWDPVRNILRCQTTPVLTQGNHVLKIIASDLNHNSTTREVSFTVANTTNAVAPPASDLKILCYPNPVTHIMDVDIHTCSGKYLTVEIFNQLGQKKSVIFDGKAATSPLRLKWDVKASGGQPVVSGLYFVKVTCDGYIFVKKIVVN